MTVIITSQKILFFILAHICLFILLHYQDLFSQESVKFNRLSIKEGLSQSSVECIIQDSLGFMWFGTEHGLNRYDGYNFTVFKNDPDDPSSISNNDIWCLFIDSGQRLWIGTYSGGLNRYDPRTRRFFRFNHQVSDSFSISSDKIRSITEDSSGYLWIGTSDAGMNRFDPHKQIFHRYSHDPENDNSLVSNTILVRPLK